MKLRRRKKSSSERSIDRVVFRRDTIFSNSDGTVDFVSFAAPWSSGYSSIHLRRRQYEDAGCPDKLIMTVTTKDVPRIESREVVPQR